MRLATAWLLPLAVLLLSAVLCTARIGRRSFWVDEGFAWFDAINFWESHAREVRPLYYLALRAWMMFGASEAWLRGFSALCATGSVLLVYLLGKRLIDARTGLLGALLLALSPQFIADAQEVRMYSMGTFLGLAGALALLRGLHKPTAGPLACWSLLRFFLLITVPLAAVLLLADGLIIFMRFKRQWRPLLRFFLWSAVTAALWAPFAIALAHDAPAFGAGWVAHTLKPGFTSFFAATLVQDTAALNWAMAARHPWLKTSSAAVLAALCLAAVIPRLRRTHRCYIALWALVPSLALAVISHLFMPLWIERYRAHALPHTMLLLAAGIWTLYGRCRVAAAAAAVLCMSGLVSNLPAYYRRPAVEDWRGVADYLRRESAAGDGIVFVSNAAFPMSESKEASVLKYYLGDSKPVEQIIKWSGKGRDQPQASSGRQHAADLARRVKRIWLVVRKGSLYQGGEEFRLLADPRGGLRPTQHRDFAGAVVVLWR